MDVDPAGWGKTRSGLLVPGSVEDTAEKPPGDPGPSARAATVWTALSAVGQLAAAVIATVAIIIALDAQAQQEEAQQMEVARKVAYWVVATMDDAVTYRIENRSASPLQPARLGVHHVTDARDVSYYELGTIAPCYAAIVTVKYPSGGRFKEYATWLMFSENYRWWSVAGAGNTVPDNGKQGYVKDAKAPFRNDKEAIQSCA